MNDKHKAKIIYSGKQNLEVMSFADKYNHYLLRLILKFMNGYANVVDFGAGIGTFAIPLKEDYGIDVVCVETDDSFINILTKRNITCIRSIDSLQDNSIDYIYTLNVLEHIENDFEIIQKFYKKLSYGGGILIYVPAFQFLYSSMDKNVGHFRRYTIRELRNKLNSAGFIICEANYVDSIGFLITILYKIFGDKKGYIDRKKLLIYDKYIFPISIIFDFFFKRFFGKNLYIFAKKEENLIKEDGSYDR